MYERMAISKKPELTITNDLKLLREEHKMTSDLSFKDPYVLDFLRLKDTYSTIFNSEASQRKILRQIA